MCPIYAVLAAPVARPLGVDVLLWFTHWRRSGLLRTATRLSTTVLSVDERTFPLRTRKLVPIGHGVDVSDLECVERPERSPLVLLALGRTSPAKGLATIVQAVAQVDDVELLVCGPSLTAEERTHKIALERLVIDLGALDRIDIRGPVPRHGVPALYADGRRARQRHARRARPTRSSTRRRRPACPSSRRTRRSTRCSRRSCGSSTATSTGWPSAIRGLQRPRPERGRPGAPGDGRARPLGRRSGPTASSSSLGERARPPRRQGRRDLRLREPPAAPPPGAARARVRRPLRDAPRGRARARRSSRRGSARAGCPSRSCAFTRRPRPGRSSAGSSRLMRRSRPADRPHAPRPCRLPRAHRRPARARPGAREHEARVQRASATAGPSRRPTARWPVSRISTSRSPRGSRGTWPSARGSTRRASRSSTTGSSRGRSRQPPPGAPRLAVVGRLVPIKGHAIAARGVRGGARAGPGADARDRRRRPARRRAARARGRATASPTRSRSSVASHRPRRCSSGRRSSSSRRSARASAWSRSRRWSAGGR